MPGDLGVQDVDTADTDRQTAGPSIKIKFTKTSTDNLKLILYLL